MENSGSKEIIWEQQQIETLEIIEVQLNTSLFIFEKELKEFEKNLKKNSSLIHKNSVRIIQIYIQCLWVEYFHRIGKIEVAKNTIKALVESVQEINIPHLTAIVYSSAASLSMLESNYTVATKYYNFAYQTFISLQKYDKALFVLSQKALVENFLGNYQTSLEILIEGIQYAKENDIQKSLGYIYKTLGIVYANLDSYDHSLTWQLEAKLFFESEQNNIGFASVLGELGNIYSYTKEYQLALDYYEQALEVAQRIGDSLTELTILTNIGSTYRDLNQIDKSFSYAYQNLDLSKRKENKRLESYALQLIGSLYLLQKEYSNAREFFTRSYHLRKELGYKRGEILSLLELASTIRLMGDLNEAVRQLYVALSLTEIVDAKRIKADIHIELMYCFEELGLWKDAHHHLFQHTLLTEQVYHERVASTIAKEKIIHEVEGAKKEALLQHQRNLELQAAYQQLNGVNKLLEQQQKEIETQLQFSRKQNVRLETLSKEKDEILAIAAHDLKNPISVILLSSSKVAKFIDKMTIEQIHSEMKTIQLTSKRMTDILKNLLEIHTLESGKYFNQTENVKLLDIFNEVIHSMLTLSRPKEISILLEPSLELNSFSTKIDRFALKSVLENLISNSIKFSENGTKIFLKFKKEISPSHFNISSSSFTVEIQDQGPGFSKEELPRIFQKFAKLSAKPTGGEHSTGLGLAIVKKYTEKMGANILCRSNQNIGTTFILKFPYNS